MAWMNKLNSTVLPEILPQVTFFTLISVIVTVVCDRTGYKMQINSVFLTVISTLISFAVSTRISSSDARYIEGRKAWSQITLGSRNLAILIWLHTPPTTLTTEELKETPREQLDLEKTKGLIEKKTMINLIQAFSVATKHYLRGESGVFYEDLYHLIACLPKYYFPSSVDNPETDRSGVLGIWKSPHPDGSRFLPVHRKKSQVDMMASISSSGTLRADVVDLEKGEQGVLPTELELLPANNPPERTIYHYCPPLNIFKPLVGWLSPSAEQRQRAKKRRNRRPHIESNIPLEISLFLSGYLDTILQRGTLAPANFGNFVGALGLLQASTVDLERILTTPVPVAYALHLRFSIYIYLLFLPFQTYSLLHWLSIVAQAVVATIFLGFLELGNQLEQPFGYDDSDLDLDRFCELIAEELQEITGHPQPDPKTYVFSPLNQPFGANDPRSAQEILDEANAAIHGDRKGTPALRRLLAQHFHRVQTEEVKKRKTADRGRMVPVTTI